MAQPHALDMFSEAPVVTFDDAILKDQATTDKGEMLQDFVLEKLFYTNMKDREDEVTTAYDKTFSWLFEPTSPDTDVTHAGKYPSILDWLQNPNDSMYWITGKPGSGKSTLMRYIYEHREKSRALKFWAGSKRLSTAAFFFWISGTIDQRSQTGLLRSLLHQLLEQDRQVIPFVFPALWTRLWDASTKARIAMVITWDIPQLVTGLTSFFERVRSTTRVALFIDGLDELDGDHSGMIRMLQDIVVNSVGDVKICVSSRPWPVFEAAFSSISKLKLQDLTRSDAIQYVNGTLFTDPRISTLR